MRRQRMPTDSGDEIQRKAAAVTYLLGQIGLSDGRETEWWNYRSYDELRGRTPTQAWLGGDVEAVEQLVRRWYLDTERALETRRKDPAFMAMIQRKSDALKAKTPNAS
jgi:hypothetical protein